ncbi:phosphate ABC transporter ATP-binding protein [Photobacterium jeanii]|uniref:Phosphate ABC transporter ATP-binding protein n=1 Tax=Photobacterium jeanii TaxID=858640 RepID=A0A178KML8_9GAMM|nr:ATP-binding cassette domain-containing protein [Photobacterium jeanii]OAN18004.1 phosphate ABC transporter ATP-binding protein [Photobacterium jeanii]PST92326.1 phosphate ABC transporter ATP-binding protein [Photobacterium jeanii]
MRPLQHAHRVTGKIANLTITFGSQTVISDVSMNLYKNRVHVLTGPSGSGKTTFLRAINRLNDCFADCYTQGKIELTIDGNLEAVHTLKSQQLPTLRQKVGMVFQHPQLLPGTIADNILLPLKVVSGMTGKVAQNKLSTALSQTTLWDEVKDRLDKPAQSLSGGQQQRLCLARTLALEPEILLLDEPTASLDPKTTEQIESLISELAQHYTIVMVSHSAQQTQKLADYIYYFEQGRVVNNSL